MSSSTSFDRAPALPRRVLVQLVEHEEDEWTRITRLLLGSSNSFLTTTPTTNRFARSWRLWMSITLTWFAPQSILCASTSAASRPRSDARSESGRFETSQERVDGPCGDVAAPVGCARPRGGRRSARTARRTSAPRAAPRPRRGQPASPGSRGFLRERSSCCSTRATRSAILAALVALLGEQEAQQPCRARRHVTVQK